MKLLPFIPLLSLGLVAGTMSSSCTQSDASSGVDGGGRATGVGGAGGGRTEDDGAAGGDPLDGGSTGGRGSGGKGGTASSGGASSGGASSGGASTADGGDGAPLPTSTFLYARSVTPDHDVLVALDIVSGDERIVTDLTGDGSDGWELAGAAISPDRRRIAIASLYGPTAQDNATRLATRRLWTLAADGSDFRRLTPVFPNTGGGKTNFNIELEHPAFTQDGSAVLYDLGNYWYEGTTLKGGSFPWLASTSGSDLPAAFKTISSCSVLAPAVNPATGEVLFIHSVCIDSLDEGLYLYPASGGTTPEVLLQAGTAAGQIDPSLTPPAWLADGSGFVFAGLTSVVRGGSTEVASALFIYDMSTHQSTPVVIPDANEYVDAATIAPDASAIVYCLRHGSDARDLHLIDLTVTPATDSAITADGKSCYPTF